MRYRERIIMSYWYWYRQTNPPPPGSWVIAGPYSSMAAAKAACEFDKRDGDVGIPFSADTREEAETRTVFQ